MKALDEPIWDDLDDDEFDTDLTVSYEFDEKVIEVRTHVEFVRPSTAFSRVAAMDPGAPSPDVTVIRHGKTMVLSGGSKMAAEADSVANVRRACEPRFSEMRLLTVGKESTRPGQVEERASDPLEDRLDVPISPQSNDCVVHAADEGTENAVKTKDAVKTTQDDAADPDPVCCAPTVRASLPHVSVPPRESTSTGVAS